MAQNNPLFESRTSFLTYLDRNTFDVIPGTECSICATNYQEGGEAPVQLPCMHIFGSLCLEKWTQQSATCPMCRTILHPIPPSKIEYDQERARLQAMAGWLASQKVRLVTEEILFQQEWTKLNEETDTPTFHPGIRRITEALLVRNRFVMRVNAGIEEADAMLGLHHFSWIDHDANERGRDQFRRLTAQLEALRDEFTQALGL
ncbi:hypothetical protein M011DRAFT_457363 [Sporormia fimetaria CBS 119925]|uniref:RING-type domain-containing protein n=1 Tax=Sporormia fimetaria CBS 119925 TaxID=1340428 RepID=A0A6A6VHN9_9PLEO|nr:hypothetical protein M011DRAFT_457363 [Sporormia fimetaria CBS 119925]